MAVFEEIMTDLAVRAASEMLRRRPKSSNNFVYCSSETDKFGILGIYRCVVLRFRIGQALVNSQPD